MSRRIKVSFEVTDNWSRGDFREFIKALLILNEQYELFIISNNNSTDYIRSVGQILGLDTNHTLVEGFTQDKLNAVVSNNIDIHLDNLLSTTTLVDETTDAYGIFVNELPNRYLMEPSYVVEFGRVVERINEENTG